MRDSKPDERAGLNPYDRIGVLYRQRVPKPCELPGGARDVGGDDAGGAVYDALVALAAREHGAALATRDARAGGAYDAAGVEVIVVT